MSVNANTDARRQSSEYLEQFIRSLQVCLESNVVNQPLMIIKQRFLLDWYRFLAFTWRFDLLTWGLGQLYALVTRVNKGRKWDRIELTACIQKLGSGDIMTIRLVCECTFSQGSPPGLNIL